MPALESLGEEINIKNLRLTPSVGGGGHGLLSGPVLLLEALAGKTWERIRNSVIYHVSQGEETITDINLLEIAMAGVREVRFWKCSKEQEAKAGIDWEFLIGSGAIGWLRYAMQGKKLNPKTKRYENLNHEVAGVPQIELLRKYAESMRAIPLYCFYNHLNEKDYTPHWHCTLDVDPPQLGCSITPLGVVQDALKKKGRPSGKTFGHIHSNKYTLPWRCLVRCPHVLSMYGGPDFTHEGFGDVHVYRELPGEVAGLFRVDKISEATYETNLNIVPKRVVVIDIGNPEITTRTRRDEEPTDNEPLPVIRDF